MIKVKTKQWGNSVGIILPKEITKGMSIKPGDEILIEIEKKDSNTLKELFGSIKFSKPTKELLKEVRKDLESKWA